MNRQSNMWVIIEVLIGLFIWMVLPGLIFQKKTKNKSPYKRFTTVVCVIVGILIVVFGAVELIKSLFHTIMS